MKKFNTLFIVIFMLMTNVFSQEKIGDWATHFSYENATQVVKGKEKAYVVADGKLFSYNPSDQHIETYSRITGLNDNEISLLAYNRTKECLLIVYNNANFDLLFSDGNIINIPDLYLVTANIDKTINDVFAYQEFFYVSTNFGFVSLNIDRGEIKETVNFNAPCYTTYRDTEKIYAVNSSGVIQCNMNENIQDKSKWETFPVSTKYAYNDYTFSDNEIRKIFMYNDKLHFFIPQKAAYYLIDDIHLDRTLQGQNITRMLSKSNNQCIAYRNNAFFVATSLGQFKKTEVSNLKSVDFADNNQFFVTTKNNNLSLIQPTSGNNAYQDIVSDLKPSGPLSNYPFFMTFGQGKLLVTGGGYYLDRFRYSAQLSEFTSEKGWYNYDLAQIKQVNNYAFDFCSAIIDPADPNHVFVTSWGEGIYEFKDGKCVKLYNKTNSTLEDIFTGTHYHRIDGLTYDKEGNMWTTNTGVKDALKILKADNSWAKMYQPALEKVENIKSIYVDTNNNKWVIAGHHKTIVVVIDDNSTIDDTSDDKTKVISELINQNDVNLSMRYFNSIVEDKTGNIWLGTDIGPLMIYNSRNIFSKDVRLNQIVIPRNDGTNYIDYLLDKTPVNSIKVDGANRKWIATSSSGVYLVSPDGSKTIEHFTMENSPMPSDEVLSLAIDDNTGIVYVGTSKGVVSYKSDAKEPADKFDKVEVYPNPVRPDYSGNIIISGLKENTVVKITDIHANLLAQGQSLGGQFSWDGRNAQGIKVQTGVYLVFGSTEDGKEGMVAKVMIVN